MQYSDEGEPPLETAGGIVRALPLLGAEDFIVVSTDVVTSFEFSALTNLDSAAAPVAGWLVLAPNPPHHPHGDFGLQLSGSLGTETSRPTLGVPATGSSGTEPSRSAVGRPLSNSLGTEPPLFTYSGIGRLRPALFHGLGEGFRPLRTVLRPAVRAGTLRGLLFRGFWQDVGTPERLDNVRAALRARGSRAAGGSIDPDTRARRPQDTGGSIDPDTQASRPEDTGGSVA